MTARKSNGWNHTLLLAAHADDRLYPCGTAFHAGANLAITAQHVLSPPFEQESLNRLVKKDPGFAIAALQVVDGGVNPLEWSITEMLRYPSAVADERPLFLKDAADDRPVDVAVLTLEPAGEVIPEIEHYRRGYFELALMPPPRGSLVMAQGFIGARLDQNPADLLELTLDMHQIEVEGEVGEIYFPMRDRAGAPFPCFEMRTDADFDPCMSGGPVFNERGQVCGVVSRGGGERPLVAMLLPILGMRCGLNFIYDLARHGSMRIHDLQRFDLAWRGDKLVPTLLFVLDAPEVRLDRGLIACDKAVAHVTVSRRMPP